MKSLVLLGTSTVCCFGLSGCLVDIADPVAIAEQGSAEAGGGGGGSAGTPDASPVDGGEHDADAGVDVAHDQSVSDSAQDVETSEGGDASSTDAVPDTTGKDSGPTCQDGQVLCGGHCAPVDDNCGECGHSCLGGSCSQGKCQPAVVASNTPGAFDIEQDQSHLYWTEESGKLCRSLKKSYQGCQILNQGSSTTYGVALDDSYVYWAGDSHIFRIPKSGGTAKQLDSGTGTGATHGVFVSGGVVYWTRMDATHGGVFARNKDGSGEEKILATDVPSPYEVAVTASRVYWTSLKDGRVYYSPIAGGAQGTVPVPYSQGFHAYGIAVDGSKVFWRAGNWDSKVAVVVKYDETSGLSSQLYKASSPGNGPRYLAVDGTHVYWTDSANQRVMRVSRQGTGPTQLFNGGVSPHGITVGTTAVYWTDWGAGKVWLLAK